MLVTFEGIEAAGKSTLIAAMAHELSSRGETVLVTKEPGGTPLGDSLRTVFLDTPLDIDAVAEVMVLNASRAQLVADVIGPALKERVVVLCDRFFDATIAYQCYGRGLNLEAVLEVCLFATRRITPELTFLIDLPVEISRERLQVRGGADRLEREGTLFHHRVREGYLALAKLFPSRFVVLDGTRSPDALAAQALEVFERFRNAPSAMIDGTFDVVGAAGPRTFFEHLTAATLSHGYLFTGPHGVGKKTFARALAHSLLCTTPKRTLLGWCGTCAGCTQFEAGTHPDFSYAEGQVKIGDREGGGFHDSDEATARDLVRELSLHSYAGGKRVFALGDADFTREAANALLKFFEEPPANVLLVVTSSASGRILPTIRSRLVEVTFPLLSEREVVEILQRHGIAADEAQRAAEVANGSASRALSFLGEGEGATRDAAIEWFFAAARGEEADASGWATRPTLDAGLEIVKTLARDWVALGLQGSVPLLARDQRARLEELPRREPAQFAKLLGALGDAERIARTNVSPPLVADLVRMALAPSSR